ncbi:MAG: hypothetical protein FJZ86_00390 [Chloroflexi bacterium]|nr:hypothetical protein [Chloroflexota bacterium]
MNQFVSKNLSNLAFAPAILILPGIIAFAADSQRALILGNHPVNRTHRRGRTRRNSGFEASFAVYYEYNYKGRLVDLLFAHLGFLA